MLKTIQQGTTRLFWLVLVIYWGVACNGGQSEANNAQATVVALSTENARLVTAVATLAQQSSNTSVAAAAATPVAVVATVAPTVPLTTTSVLTTTVAPTTTETTTETNLVAANSPVPVKDPSPEPGPLPTTLDEIPLAPEGAVLLDFYLDQPANRIYLTDNANHLYVLDAANHMVLATIPAAGALTMDTAQHRLYVAPADLYFMPMPAITVIDTQLLTITASISDATHLALDTAHNRLFVGSRVSATSAQTPPDVRVLNADSLTPVATIPQAGIPVYNSIRNELFIVSHTIYAVDPDTAQVKQDLLPEISGQPLPWCDGCNFANNAYVFPNDNLVAFDIEPIALGKGAGLMPAPRFFDATSMAAITKPADIPTIQPGCGSQKNLLKPVNNRIYRHQSYDRYVFYNNLLIDDLDGNLLALRDGLEQPFINPQTNQAYANGWVLDLDTWLPIGQMPSVCLFMQDAPHGLLYGSRQNDLLVLADRGGQPAASTPGTPAALPEKSISQISFSPDYANDKTLFVISEKSRLYRSVDGGQTWSMLRGALPMNSFATLSFAISPDFAQDHTLFTGGYLGESWGEGVLRSTDGGDTWQPMWNNLSFLRVYRLALSPTYATDGALLAYAHYARLAAMENGVAVQRSTDRGVSWSVALTTTDEASAPTPSEVLGTPATPLVPLRIAANNRQIERTMDNGQTWQLVNLSLPDDALLLQVLPSPGYPDDGTLYILGDSEVWRVTDNGATFQAWGDSRLQGRDAESKLSAIAVSPKASDGAYQLVIGTNAGEFWPLNPATLQWQTPEQAASVTPTTSATPTGSSTPIVQAATNVTPTAVVPPATALTPTQTLTATKPITAELVPLASPTVSGPTPTPPAPLAGEPPAGLYRPEGAFASQWEKDTRLQQGLGWAKTAAAGTTAAAIQTFDHGTMIWRSDTQQIYVIYADRTWAVFTDTFKEGDAESDPNLRVPQGKLQPMRGFGKIWRENPTVHDKLGWATAKEQGINSPLHNFEHGFMLRAGGLVYGLVEQADGTRVWY
ncbi:MAG: hypothetical protein NT075_16240 [Chloroflexi bacterium]|nr:hypothetical protein [Chloroflexota bacterium]